MLNIFHIIPTLSAGGAERIAVDLCGELANNNKVALIQLSAGKESHSFYRDQLSHKVVYYNLKGVVGKTFQNSVFVKLFQLIKVKDPDVVHCHLNIFYCLILSLLFRETKFYYTVHSDASKDCLRVKGISFRKVLQFYFKRKIIIPLTISVESKISFDNFYGVSNSFLIPNGAKKLIKTSKFNLVNDEINLLKPGSKTRVLLNVARCSDAKNHNLLITTFNSIIEKGYDAILLVVGDGFDSEYGLSLKSKACNKIYFLGSKQNVSDYYINSDAFCLSSKWEGLPISLLEAMSVGVIPICTPVGGIPNVIKDGITGYLSASISEEDYINKLIEFLENNIINKEKIINEFDQKYSIQNCTHKHENLYMQ